MEIGEVLFLALALSIDAFAVSFSYGFIIKQNRFINTLKLATATGFAQFAMPLFGWIGAKSISDCIEPFAHWIVFTIFMILGLNIIYKALTKEKNNAESNDKLYIKLTAKTLFMLALATSIDALFAGTTLFFADVNILIAVLVIGIVTFIASAIAYNLNVCFSKIPVKWLEMGAGTILILLALKALGEHFL